MGGVVGAGWIGGGLGIDGVVVLGWEGVGGGGAWVVRGLGVDGAWVECVWCEG